MHNMPLLFLPPSGIPQGRVPCLARPPNKTESARSPEKTPRGRPSEASLSSGELRSVP